MEITKEIKIVDLAIYVNGVLIISDVHLGYEESLNNSGIFIPRFLFKEVIIRLEQIFESLKGKPVDTIIINGDLKHEFGKISSQEWRNTLRLLDFLGRHCNRVILVRGNHDKIIGPIAEKRKVLVVDHLLVRDGLILGDDVLVDENKNIAIKKESLKNKKSIGKTKNKKSGFKNKDTILVIHGDKIPLPGVLSKADTIIIGHEHPAVSIQEGARVEKFKAFIVGKYLGKTLIVQPSFNLVTEGTEVLKEKVLSPFLKQDISKFSAFIVSDKVYRFGMLRDI